MRKLAFFNVIVLLAGCTVGPKYKRPSVDVPADYRAITMLQNSSPVSSLGNENWWQVYQDPDTPATSSRFPARTQEKNFAASLLRGNLRGRPLRAACTLVPPCTQLAGQ